jgi:hypothetical protein
MMIALLGVGVAAWRPAPRPLVGGGPSAAARPSVAFGDPLELANWSPVVTAAPARPPSLAGIAAAATAAMAAGTQAPLPAFAAYDLSELQGVALNPSNFNPVCPASDSFYRFGQTLVVGVVGPESYKEYAPLIAGGLLRVRLELCVVESFFYEAILPFIKENGLSWVLPLHETVETFLAGTIFAVASNFILIGSTKIITVVFTYLDFFLGFPLRLVGSVGWRALEDKAIGIAEAERQEAEKKRPWWKGKKPREAPPIDEVWEANSGDTASQVQFVAWGALLGTGQLTKGIRTVAEAFDLFVGRYLLLTTVAYVGIKFVHFKLWDPIPF